MRVFSLKWDFNLQGVGDSIGDKNGGVDVSLPSMAGFNINKCTDLIHGNLLSHICTEAMIASVPVVEILTPPQLLSFNMSCKAELITTLCYPP